MSGFDYAFFYNSIDGDRKYDADSFELWLKKFFTSGVFAGDLETTANNNMTVSVSPGYANTDGKVRLFMQQQNLQLETADALHDRVDSVVVERNDIERNITLKIVKGTPAAVEPVRKNGIYQLVLAQIRVVHGAVAVTQENITDTRTDRGLCGIVTGTVEEYDFSHFQKQFDSYFARYKQEVEQEANRLIADTEQEFERLAIEGDSWAQQAKTNAENSANSASSSAQSAARAESLVNEAYRIIENAESGGVSDIIKIGMDEWSGEEIEDNVNGGSVIWIAPTNHEANGFKYMSAHEYEYETEPITDIYNHYQAVGFIDGSNNPYTIQNGYRCEKLATDGEIVVAIMSRGTDIKTYNISVCNPSDTAEIRDKLQLPPDGLGRELNDILYADGKFVIAGSGGIILWGTVNDNELQCSYIIDGSDVISLAYGNGRWIAGTNTGAYYSDNLIDWNKSTHAEGESEYCKQIAFGNGYFLAAKDEGIISKSESGTSWERVSQVMYIDHNGADVRLLVFTGESFVLAGQTGIFVTKNGTEWKNISATLRMTDGSSFIDMARSPVSASIDEGDVLLVFSDADGTGCICRIKEKRQVLSLTETVKLLYLDYLARQNP